MFGDANEAFAEEIMTKIKFERQIDGFHPN